MFHLLYVVLSQMGTQQHSRITMACQTVIHIPLSKKLHPKDFEYEHFISLYFKSGNKFEEETEIIDKDVIRGRTDFSVFNYSMKEFFFTVQLGV